jgi:RNA polymerase sigma factor (sigma-70 family)
MPPDRSRSADDFARRLFDPGFVKKVKMASRPCFPRGLASRRDDIIEEALLKAYHAREQFRGATDDALLGWVLEILRNHALDIVEAEEDRPQVVSLPTIEITVFRGTDADDLRDDPDDVADGRHAPDDDESRPDSPRAAMLAVLAELTPDERDVLLLRLDRGFTLRETAAALSTPERPVSVAAVKMRQHRAMIRVMELMAARGVAPEMRKRPPEAPETAA